MGERRESNPRMLESQPSALTTWLRSPIYLALLNNSTISLHSCLH
jgi:hypothetical protein